MEGLPHPFADLLGFAIALSGDGNTLAVSANFEDSSASGIDGDGSTLAVGAIDEDSAAATINGDQRDNSAENAGAALSSAAAMARGRLGFLAQGRRRELLLSTSPRLRQPTTV